MLPHKQTGGFYLIAQACSTLQQSLPSILIDNEPTNLWRNGSFRGRLWAAASSRWAFLIGWRRRQTFWSGWGALCSFYISAIIIQGKWGTTLAQAAALGLNLEYRFITGLCEMESLVMHRQVKAMGPTYQGPEQYKTSCHHKCDKHSIYLATGGHCKLIYSWHIVPHSHQPCMVWTVLQAHKQHQHRLTFCSSLSHKCLLLNFLFPEGLSLHSGDASLSW